MVNKITSSKTPIEQNEVINGIIDEIQPATSSSTGVVKPDNVSIVVEDGVISSLAGTPPDQTFDGTSIKAQSGVAITGLLGLLYPVGSLYITTQYTGSSNYCPIASLISGSQWQLVAQDRALWGGNGPNANTTIAAGLPNITGNFYSERDWQGIFRAGQDGAFNGVSRSGWGVGNEGAGQSTNAVQVNFNASRSSSIYGKSSTVQPPAYRVNVWRRIA